MKKVSLLTFVTAVAVTLSACGGKNTGKASDSAVTDDTASEVYSYYEEVPVAAPGQPDPDAVEATSGKTPYVVDFYADWCPPCKKLKPYFRQMEETYAGQAVFRTVNVDENKALAQKNNVNSIPTVIIYSDSTMNTELYRVEGFDPTGIEEAIMEFI